MLFEPEVSIYVKYQGVPFFIFVRSTPIPIIFELNKSFMNSIQWSQGMLQETQNIHKFIDTCLFTKNIRYGSVCTCKYYHGTNKNWNVYRKICMESIINQLNWKARTCKRRKKTGRWYFDGFDSICKRYSGPNREIMGLGCNKIKHFKFLKLKKKIFSEFLKYLLVKYFYKNF